MNRFEDNAGFTLIELTLSVLIIAIITAVGIPSFKSVWYKSELQRVSSEFIGTLRYAQQRSVMERQPVRVVIDVRERTYWVPVEEEKERKHYKSRSHRTSSRRRDTHSRRRVKEVKEIRGQLSKDFIFEFVYDVGDDDEIKRGEAEIYFYPDGSADAFYITLLRLAGRANEERRLFVKVLPASGLIKSMEGFTNDQGSDFYRGYFDDRRYAG